MGPRIFGIVVTGWFLFTILSLVVALAFSPMGLRLLLPEEHPVTWIYPALLVLPPVIIATRNLLGARATLFLLWPLAVVLAAFDVLLLVFLGSALLGI